MIFSFQQTSTCHYFIKEHFDTEQIFRIDIPWSNINLILLTFGFDKNDSNDSTEPAYLSCSYVSLLYWMRTIFPEYKTFKGKATSSSRVNSTDYVKTKSVLKSLHSHKLNIYVANPEWGINKKTGECSEENIQMNDIIKSSGTLLELREFCVSFKTVIAGNSMSDLVAWIEKYKTEPHPHLRTFATGLLRDIDAEKTLFFFHTIMDWRRA